MSRLAKPCPICRKPAAPEHHPFCSKRCSNIDLGRWLGGQYAIPAEEPPDPMAEDDEPLPRLH
jgi:endogenous inhibitor of DNA gyrase (YacG/DUF329 family)